MYEREPGTVLDGKYEILRRIGGGGMGEVFMVRHLHLEEQRVIKILRPEQASEPAAQARFLRAARTATQIKHPNVAILYDYSSLPDSSFFMVWEYIEGTDVSSWIDEHGPVPLDDAVAIGIQALRGLEAIHSVGVIHRDISPDKPDADPRPQRPTGGQDHRSRSGQEPPFGRDRSHPDRDVPGQAALLLARAGRSQRGTGAGPGAPISTRWPRCCTR